MRSRADRVGLSSQRLVRVPELNAMHQSGSEFQIYPLEGDLDFRVGDLLDIAF
jgi:hypothetical protein